MKIRKLSLLLIVMLLSSCKEVTGTWKSFVATDEKVISIDRLADGEPHRIRPTSGERYGDRQRRQPHPGCQGGNCR